MIIRFFFFTSLFLTISIAQSQDLKYELLFEVEAKLDTPIEIGNLPQGHRTIFPFREGKFEGPKMKGVINAPGADWSLKVNETTSLLDIRGLYTLDSGEHIYVQAKGYLHFSENNTYYLRSTPVFETSASGYEWLNHIVSVGVGELTKTGIRFKIYEIK